MLRNFFVWGLIRRGGCFIFSFFCLFYLFCLGGLLLLGERRDLRQIFRSFRRVWLRRWGLFFLLFLFGFLIFRCVEYSWFGIEGWYPWKFRLMKNRLILWLRGSRQTSGIIGFVNELCSIRVRLWWNWLFLKLVQLFRRGGGCLRRFLTWDFREFWCRLLGRVVLGFFLIGIFLFFVIFIVIFPVFGVILIWF